MNMPSRRDWLKTAAATVKTAAKPPYIPKVALLDTQMGSENSGDQIIMEACGQVMAEVLSPDATPAHVATHYYSPELESLGGSIPILCGTNILYTHMGDQRQWALPHRLRSLRNVCLLGVGMNNQDLDDPVDAYSRLFYKAVLHPSLYHSVRNSTTKQKLEEAGVRNVLNTACPTMWTLTPEHLATIPRKKASTVLTSVTDYCADATSDLLMIETLKQEYEHVVIWVQGSHDIDFCLDPIINKGDYQLIGPSIDELNAFLADPDVDYVGTRLHAGIRSLNLGHRSLIVNVDNRARSIARDTGLPVIERSELAGDKLVRWINGSDATELSLPWEEINLWKSQWSRR